MVIPKKDFAWIIYQKFQDGLGVKVLKYQNFEKKVQYEGGWGFESNQPVLLVIRKCMLFFLCPRRSYLSAYQ